VANCLGHARFLIDLADQKNEVVKLVMRGGAKPLRPEAGTKPKVFYIG